MGYTSLEDSIGITKAEISALLPEAKAMMNQFSETMRLIISEHLKLSKFKSDPGLMVDSYFDISRSVGNMTQHLPSEKWWLVPCRDCSGWISWATNWNLSRIFWLSFHHHFQRYSHLTLKEAGMTKILSAILVIKYLSLFGEWKPVLALLEFSYYVGTLPDAWTCFFQTLSWHRIAF